MNLLEQYKELLVTPEKISDMRAKVSEIDAAILQLQRHKHQLVEKMQQKCTHPSVKVYKCTDYDHIEYEVKCHECGKTLVDGNIFAYERFENSYKGNIIDDE